MGSVLSSSEVVRRLNDLGFRPTTPRRIIVDYILAQTGRFSAQDIYDQLRQIHAHIGRATVFRTISLLERIGALEALHLEDGRHGYIVCGLGHHHHLVCTHCGKSIQFEDLDLERHIQQLSERNAFAPNSHRLEIFGLCPDCQAAA